MILCCPDKLRGSLGAAAAAGALARGADAAGAEAVRHPLADGGEGTLDVVLEAAAAAGVEVREAAAADALGRPVRGRFAILPGGRALVELAEVAGHVPVAERDVMAAGTFGVGMLVRAALDAGAREVTVAAGGSASVDGGLGALRALGARLLGEDGEELEGTAAGLVRLAEVDASGLDPRLRGSLEIAADVIAPLGGPDGAARGFGPQKGATPGQVEELEAALPRLADLLGLDAESRARAGAAGGFAVPFLALAGARVVSGAAMVRDATGFADALGRARLCVTAEGRVDRQTALGKTAAGVVEAARDAGVPAVVVAGEAEEEGVELLYGLGAAGVFGLQRGPVGAEQARAGAAADLEAFGRALAGVQLAATGGR